jgi:hypothetical protein
MQVGDEPGNVSGFTVFADCRFWMPEGEVRIKKENGKRNKT